MRFTFTLLLVWVSVVTYAQIQRGDHIITLDRFTNLLSTAEDFGGVKFETDHTYTFLSLSATNGYALTNRIVIGGTPGVELLISRDYRYYNFTIDPYLRYYVVNQAQLGIFGQVSTGLSVGEYGVAAFHNTTLRAGLQLPLTSGVRIGPALDYVFLEELNRTSLGVNLEIVLSTRGVGKQPLGKFGEGSVMIGGQLGNVWRRKTVVGGQLNVGGYYFLTDRLATGLSVDVTGGRRKNVSTGGLHASGIHLLSNVGLRYYVTTGQRLVWYGEVGGGYVYSTWRTPTHDSYNQVTENAWVLSGAVGGQYFLRENIALEFGPQFRRSAGDADLSSVGLTTGARIFLR